MAGATVRIPTGCPGRVNFSGGPESPAVMIFEFLEGDESPETVIVSGNSESFNDGVRGTDFEDDLEEEEENVEENKAFWETKDQLLQTTLYKTSSIESKIRQATKQALRDLKSIGIPCTCQRLSVSSDGCRTCLHREMCDRLRNAGYNCAICKSRWRKTSTIPSGEHTYLEVLDNSNPIKGEIRVVIDLNFRAEFEMAKASEEYNRLTARLPEVFVGKPERLRELIKILCTAAKKCMKEKKMHLGPWRKHKYMQAKWLGAFERTTKFAPARPVGVIDRPPPPKPRASMLTFDLANNMSILHCTAVKVL